MIASCRADQADHEGYLAEGMSSWMRGEDGPQAVAASRIVAETFLMWRAIMNSKLER
jgi:hypothetical protein